MYKKIRSYFKFNKQERSGIFFLLLAIVMLQVAYFTFRSSTLGNNGLESFSVDEEVQAQIELLKESASKKSSTPIFPFNPNYITDYKGYALGMSVNEIDRLHTFRAQGKFANSSEEFQQVTQVSDSLLKAISPYFKFPEWTQKKEIPATADRQPQFRRPSSKGNTTTTRQSLIKDLNKATAEDLRTIRGIGEKLSERILNFREKLGGFLIDEQLYDVYWLEPEVAERALEKFKVLQKPNIAKININSASAEELSKVVYINWYVAERIVEYRTINNGISSFDELSEIEDFPSEKIDRIALYLSL